MSKDLIIYKLANKYDLPLSKVRKIVEYQFKYAAKIMKEGKFEYIRLPYFGRFSVKPNRIKYVNKLKKK